MDQTGVRKKERIIKHQELGADSLTGELPFLDTGKMSGGAPRSRMLVRHQSKCVGKGGRRTGVCN